ncbi:MAG: tetratricopeptide repeat protein [Verrucomicrobia bacterium]|nr:tetratricopeptide repeat protein [Verrucomicrobiota bacterium]
MNQIPVLLLLVIMILVGNARGDSPRAVDVKSADGTVVKGTYFAAAKPGPGILLFHQSNRTRECWDDVAKQSVAAGINTLTIDLQRYKEEKGWGAAEDAAFEFLVSQPGVSRDIIGIGGAGALGVDLAVETARRHATQLKSLVLISGETSRQELQFLHEASQLPGLYVFSDDDEYPPEQEAMQLIYDTSSNPSKKLIHYSAVKEAPWLWYETSDSRVPAKGGHGTDLFKPHPELRTIVVDWFITTLIKTPGHAPADPLACAAVLNELQMPGGETQVQQQLTEARKKDPQAQLFPEVNVDILASGFLRDGATKEAIEIFKLNLLAYPDSADAHYNLADAYLKDGQKDLARNYAERALAMLDSHAAPLSSWSDTEQRRAEIRKDIQDTLKKIGEEK